jgi:hypothetical protein
MTCMSGQRNQLWVGAGMAATVHVLAGTQVYPGRQATVTSLEANVLTLSAEEIIHLGAAVRVDAGEALFLGEVVHAQAGNVAVRVEQVIPSVPDILRLVEGVMGEAAPSERSVGTGEKARAAIC